MSPVLKSLHCLPVTYGKDFKVLLLGYKSVINLEPKEYIPSGALIFRKQLTGCTSSQKKTGWSCF